MVSEQGRRLWLAYLCGGFGLSMAAQISFLVPLRARDLGAGLDLIGLIVGVGALAAAITSIPCGSIIDRLGPRCSFLLGATATAIVSVMLRMSRSSWNFGGFPPGVGAA